MCYTSALKMPSSYAVMNEEEMMYLEGGEFYGVSLTAKQCRVIADTLSILGDSLALTSLACGAIAFIPGLQSAIAGVKITGALSTACFISELVFDYCARNNGITIGFETSKNKFVYSIK